MTPRLDYHLFTAPYHSTLDKCVVFCLRQRTLQAMFSPLMVTDHFSHIDKAYCILLLAMLIYSLEVHTARSSAEEEVCIPGGKPSTMPPIYAKNIGGDRTPSWEHPTPTSSSSQFSLYPCPSSYILKAATDTSIHSPIHLHSL